MVNHIEDWPLFQCAKETYAESSGASLAKRPCLESKTEACQGSRKSSGGSVSASSDSRKNSD